MGAFSRTAADFYGLCTFRFGDERRGCGFRMKEVCSLAVGPVKSIPMGGLAYTPGRMAVMAADTSAAAQSAASLHSSSDGEGRVTLVRLRP